MIVGVMVTRTAAQAKLLYDRFGAGWLGTCFRAGMKVGSSRIQSLARFHMPSVAGDVDGIRMKTPADAPWKNQFTDYVVMHVGRGFAAILLSRTDAPVDPAVERNLVTRVVRRL